MMKIFLRLSTLLIAAIPLSGGCSSPPGRYQTAVVKMSGSLPCFGIEASTEAERSPPSIANVRVAQLKPGGASLLWEANYASQQPEVKLIAGACISLGSGSGAPALKVGRRYSVSILGDIKTPNGESEVRNYFANFCMVEHKGVLEPLQVLRDKRSGIWNWAVCGPTESP